MQTLKRFFGTILIFAILFIGFVAVTFCPAIIGVPAIIVCGILSLVIANLLYVEY